MVLRVCPRTHLKFTSPLDEMKDERLTITQGHGQGLNLRDNGLNVIIGIFPIS